MTGVGAGSALGTLPSISSDFCRGSSSNAHVQLGLDYSGANAELASGLKTKGLIVWLDRKALCLPGFQAAFEKFDSRQMHGLCFAEDSPAGLVARAGAVDDDFAVLRNDRWIFNYFLRGNPSRTGNDLRIDQQVERQTHIEEKHTRIRSQH